VTDTTLRTLLVADDPEAAGELSELLAATGCAVELVVDARAGAQRAGVSGYDLIVLAVRRHIDADPQNASRPHELLDRVGDLLRGIRAGLRRPSPHIVFGDVEVDFERRVVRKAGRKLNLTAKELDLLRHLVDRRPAPVSRDSLLRSVWEYQDGVSTRTVDVHVATLRQKLEDSPRRPRHLKTVRGVGYRFLE
jgi:DNA-binding response OmpR family regulator